MATQILPLFPWDEQPNKQERRKGLRPTEAAYIAGLLDGEGYFGLQRKLTTSRRKPYYTWEYFVYLVMTQEAFMNDIARLIPWGGGTVGNNSRHLKGRAKPGYRMKWSMRAAYELCCAIVPYLRLKKRHAELIIEMHEMKQRAQHERSGQGHAYPEWINVMQRNVLVEFKQLNQRGQDNATRLT